MSPRWRITAEVDQLECAPEVGATVEVWPLRRMNLRLAARGKDTSVEEIPERLSAEEALAAIVKAHDQQRGESLRRAIEDAKARVPGLVDPHDPGPIGTYSRIKP